MKLSISMPDEDVAFLDQYARAVGERSRSAVIQLAVRALKQIELGPSYAAAWEEWTSSGESEAWDSAVADGLDRGPQEEA